MKLTRVTNEMRIAGEVRGAHVRVVGGPSGGESFDVPPMGILVGASAEADLVLDDPAVSARHCSIVPTSRGFQIVDLKSKNGTFVDGVAVQNAIVPVGGTVRVGGSALQLLPECEVNTLEPSAACSFGDLVGSSVAMRTVYALLERAAASDATVVLTGESGTGKELAARAIHEASARREGSFVVFDCGAASDNLIESDLFGHRRGAFTGADRDRPGAFVRADGGTLFLDEIGDLPLQLQPKLLRMLEMGEVTPLGGDATETSDVRIVAATHRDLWTDAHEGTFRTDLYYRLAVVEVHMPSLRARREDIPELVSAILDKQGIEPGSIAGDNLGRLQAHAWPGNVRELRNVVTRAAVLAQKGAPFTEWPVALRTMPGTERPPAVVADRPFREAKDAVVEQFERAYLEDLLRRAAGNISEAARIAEVERKYLYRLLDKHGLR
jgi:DNA-binding NtrC family response regulator